VSGVRGGSSDSWPSAIRRLTPRRWHRACTGSPSAWPRPVTGARPCRPHGRRSPPTGAWSAGARRTSTKGSPARCGPMRQSSGGRARRPTPPASAGRARPPRSRRPWRTPSEASEGRRRPGGAGARGGLEAGRIEDCVLRPGRTSPPYDCGLPPVIWRTSQFSSAKYVPDQDVRRSRPRSTGLP